jgi:predicted HicB family RNase H-like nuclease
MYVEEANTKFVEFFTKGRMTSYFKVEDIEVIKAWVKYGAPMPDNTAAQGVGSDDATQREVRPKISPELSRALELSAQQLPASVNKFDAVKSPVEILNIYQKFRVKNNSKYASLLSTQADLFIQKELSSANTTLEDDNFNFRFSPELAKEILKSSVSLVYLIGTFEHDL